jgi:hypothetical protein
MIAIEEEGIPQGLKPLSCSGLERAKPEGLAYLEAKAKAEAKATATAKAKTKATADPLRG